MGIFKKRTRIDAMNLDEISTVWSGDDPEALIVISKADPNGQHMSNEGTDVAGTLPVNTNPVEENMPPEMINKDDLPDDVVEYIEGLEEIAADKLGLFDLGDDHTDVSKNDPGDEDDDDDDVGDDVDSILKSNPVLAGIIKEAQDAATAAEKRAEAAEAIAKAEQERRVEAEMIAKAESLSMITQDKSELAGLLGTLYKSDPETASKVEQILKAADAQLREAGLFEEFGKSGTGLNSEVEAAAAEIRKANPEMTPEQAAAAAYEANPSLYDNELRGN